MVNIREEIALISSEFLQSINDKIEFSVWRKPNYTRSFNLGINIIFSGLKDNLKRRYE